MTARLRGRARALAARIDAATPAHRDRAVDALRALAITGVILGHWLVTALVLTRAGPGTALPGAAGATAHAAGPLAGVALRDASPLATMPALAPLSWIFQTLAVFFFVGGYAAARSCPAPGRGYPGWLYRRLTRLSWPVLLLLGAWALAAAGLWLAGLPGPVLGTVLKLVLSPLWFLGVYAGLTALTPLAVALVRRLGPAAAALPAAVVAGTDAVRFGLGGPAWAGWVNVAAGWLVPYLLGIAWARGAFRGRAAAVIMLGAGAAATAALVAWAGYPASMVGVNGAAVSNLNPPTLAAVTFGVAQAGLALLAAGPLRRMLRRPGPWAVVALANLSAMTLFLWHQSAFIAVTMAGLLSGPLPGLHTAPAGIGWVAERLCWLPAFAL
ncbi:MAG TPA: acyltransferase, partial [Streptosporangiaceae bacterium]|nr:acyltransferase [Streptosporangiaceae bacterium]